MGGAAVQWTHPADGGAAVRLQRDALTASNGWLALETTDDPNQPTDRSNGHIFIMYMKNI